MPIFHLQFEAIPMPESDAFEESGGAFVNCWVAADSEASALERASKSVRASLWTIISVTEECAEVAESDYAFDKLGLEYFRQAAVDGECYVFHQWPNEPQEEDDLH